MLEVMLNNGEMTHIAALTLALIVTIFISIGILFCVFYFVGMWKLYKKLGLEGWYVFIPFYRKWVLFEKLGLEWYWFIIYHLPFILFFLDEPLNGLAYVAMLLAGLVYIYNIAKIFKKGNGWMVVAFLFSEIALPLLGLAKNDVADNSVVLCPNGFIGEKKPVTKPVAPSKAKKVSKTTKTKKTSKKEDK